MKKKNKKKIHLHNPKFEINRADKKLDSSVILSYCGWAHADTGQHITDDPAKATCKHCLKIFGATKYEYKVHFRADVVHKHRWRDQDFVVEQGMCGAPYGYNPKMKFTYEEDEITCKSCKKYFLARVMKSI